MATFLDIVFSTILGGVILLITLNANSILRETWSVYNNDLMVQQMLVANAQIIEGEFRNMGSGVAGMAGAGSDTIPTIRVAEDTCIQFLMAPVARGPVSEIKYYSGLASELTNTDNPNDRFLYRQENTAPAQRVGMITQFRLRYFTEAGDTIITPVPANQTSLIRIVEITMEVQSPFAVVKDPNMDGSGNPSENRYATALWKQTRLASQNLKR